LGAIILVFAVIAGGILVSSFNPLDPFGIVIGLAILLPSLFFLARALVARVTIHGELLTSHGYAKTVTISRSDVLATRSSHAGTPDFVDLIATAWSPEVIVTNRDPVELVQLSGYGWGSRRNRRVEAQTARLEAWLADGREATE
jgi:hypothetical protein